MIAVVYLARGVGEGLASAVAFLESYDRFRPKIAHRLVIVTKGWEQESGLLDLHTIAQSYAADIEALPDDGFDWGSYMRIAPRLTEKWICFFYGNSRVQSPLWLDTMFLGTQIEKVGAVGASGSCGTLSPHLFQNWIDWALLPYRFVTMAPRFPPFPNPHLRSNAFLTRRDLFIDYVARHKIPRRKIDAHVMECGRAGYCRYLSSRGYDFVVAGQDGKFYSPDSWVESNTFCTGDQSNLLVADNRSEQYRLAGPATRNFLERAIWGRSLTR